MRYFASVTREAEFLVQGSCFVTIGACGGLVAYIWLFQDTSIVRDAGPITLVNNRGISAISGDVAISLVPDIPLSLALGLSCETGVGGSARD